MEINILIWIEYLKFIGLNLRRNTIVKIQSFFAFEHWLYFCWKTNQMKFIFYVQSNSPLSQERTDLNHTTNILKQKYDSFL